MASAQVQRKFFVGGNWKSTGTQASVKKLVDGLAAEASATIDPSLVEVTVAPAFPHLPLVGPHLPSGLIALSSQNVGDHAAGAFTGSSNLEMLTDLGVSHVILGHSERRAVFGETNALVGKKAARVLAHGGAQLTVIACVGETLDERNAGRTAAVVLEQVAEYAKNISSTALWQRVVIAYEPVWAIGTGVVASPEDAQQVHREIRQWISANVCPHVAAAVRIIYGGSVKSNNCAALSLQPDIDGFLVGGASLDPKEFLAIVSNSEKKKSIARI